MYGAYKVHCGGGVPIDEEKFQYIFKAKSDSLCCRQLLRAILEPSELDGRSATGQPSRRFMKTGMAAKPSLTPRKLEAAEIAFRKYITDRLGDLTKTTEITARGTQFRKHVGNMLNDVNKKKLELQVENVLNNTDKARDVYYSIY
ncbi:BEN domain-containing protein 5-like [Ornithodoros turicata]|uniref:BEN domain-containing protein 5-like n=1 Tax=Ornithodoros turicata TaxID=34597 RepID=UPI003139CE8D